MNARPYGPFPHLELVPATLDDALEFCERHHRHHDPSVGHKFSIGAAMPNGVMYGIITVGRPISRGYQDGWTLEATRLTVDTAPNACSFLYAAAWRAARALGWRRLITYTLKSESGASLRAAGWRVIGEVKGRRDAVLIELNETYAAMARERIRDDAPLFADGAA